MHLWNLQERRFQRVDGGYNLLFKERFNSHEVLSNAESYKLDQLIDCMEQKSIKLLIS